MIGHFPSGEAVRASLAASKLQGLPFLQAWNLAMQEAHLRPNGVPLSARRQEIADALKFARPAFRRAYEGQPRTRQDVLAGNLLAAMAHLLDHSSDAELRERDYDELMAA